MGSSPYFYYVEYEVNYNSALQKLRQREFIAGRYNPVVWFPEFPITDSTVSLGKQHPSIEEAMEAAEEDGTRSILDLNRVSIENEYCVARILSDDELIGLFGTTKPTRETLENCDELFERIERGKGVCVPVYDDMKPVQLYFLGYSFD